MAVPPTAERSRARLGALASSGLDLRGFGEAAMALLHEAVPFEAACTLSLDPATLLVTDTVKVQLPSDRDDEWVQHEYEFDDVAQFTDLGRRSNTATTVERETHGEPHRSRRMSEFHMPNCRLGHELRSAVHVDGEVWGGLCLFREEGPRGFSPAEVEFVETVSESIALGIRAALVAGAANWNASPRGPAVVIVHADDAVELVSDGARELLESIDADTFVGLGPLPLHLLTLVAAARAYRAGRYPRPPRMRLKGSCGHWLVAHAAPMASGDGSPGAVVVTIEEARPPEIVPLVVAAFGLSPREHDVVRMVLQGVDTAQIAHSLAVSAYTVQDHLKSIFEKAGVRSRKELMGKVFLDQYASRIGAPVGPSGWFAGRTSDDQAPRSTTTDE